MADQEDYRCHRWRPRSGYLDVSLYACSNFVEKLAMVQTKSILAEECNDHFEICISVIREIINAPNINSVVGWARSRLQLVRHILV